MSEQSDQDVRPEDKQPNDGRASEPSRNDPDAERRPRSNGRDGDAPDARSSKPRHGEGGSAAGRDRNGSSHGGGARERGDHARGDYVSGPRGYGAGASGGDRGASRPARSGDARDGGAPRRPGASGSDRPRRGDDKRGTERRSFDARGTDRRDSGPRGNDRGSNDRRSNDRGGNDRRSNDRGGVEHRMTEAELEQYALRSVRNRHDDPIVPDDVKPGDLDRVARAQLKTLAKENAEAVALHMVMAARLIESDPELAHRHATSAARRAGRIAVVRETLAITAYAVGDFALTLRELRTYRRISGRNDQLPMMVDSERGLGRPDRALELGRSVPRSELPVDVQVELAIAMSGARLDLGQLDAALGELEIPQLDPDRAFSWSPALFSAYATVLEDLGRASEAEEWNARADRAADALDGTTADSEDDDIVEVFEEELEDEAGDAAGDEPAADDGSGSDQPDA
ncbi:hypothetical protein FB562_1419 [Homoserinimonas aerilata]|uniref:Primosomal protein n=1 Tax=Homoserinimonas aerilata TaxID=1162970 RepID=A0A542YJQ5_9MICO|nr:primosomal protein [Homoserinimonas aerilata]TQL48328.1 hypothetical protein FB562_1419 [Homoserinimonas aerilata]